MWLFFKSTHLVHPCTPHHGGTPLQNSGTPWDVRYTRLTSTALRHHVFCFSHLCPKASCSQVNGLFELFKAKYASFHGNVRMSRNFDCKCVIGGLILNSLSNVSSPSANILLSSLKCKHFVMCSKRTLVIKVLTYWMPKFFDQYSRVRGAGHMDIFSKTAKTALYMWAWAISISLFTLHTNCFAPQCIPP